MSITEFKVTFHKPGFVGPFVKNPKVSHYAMMQQRNVVNPYIGEAGSRE